MTQLAYPSALSLFCMLTLIFQCVQYATVELVTFEHFRRLTCINIGMFFEELNNLKLVNIPLTYVLLMLD